MGQEYGASAPTGRGGRVWRAIRLRLIGYPAVLGVALLALWLVSIRMPGTSFAGPVPPPTPAEAMTAERLRAHVETLAVGIGPRSFLQPKALEAAAAYVERQFAAAGFAVTRRPHVAGGREYVNLEVTLNSRTATGPRLVVGAHYDGIADTPGADDNASGTAVLLELATLLAREPLPQPVTLVAFVNEEPPFFWSDSMGSRVWVREAVARGDSVSAMLSLEWLGYYRDDAGSQRYPPILGWFYPATGDFLAVVGNVASRGLVHRVIGTLRDDFAMPTAGAAAPSQIPGIGWSDQWAFWQEGIPAVMLTDTAPFRNPGYHMDSDIPSRLDYARLARVTHGVARVVRTLATP